MTMNGTINLNGEWEFFYSPQAFVPGKSVLPDAGNFTGKMVIPGYWDDHYDLFGEEDFFGLTARFNPDYRPVVFPMARSLTPHAASSFLIGTGFYRKKLTLETVPQTAVLQVGPAMWGCAVFCNGQCAGVNTGYSTGSEFAITGMLKPGGNEIIIAVCNRHDDGGAYCRLDGTHAGMDFGTRPGQHRGLAAQGYQSERGGIGRGVTLLLRENSRLRDWFISFENEIPHWHTDIQNPSGCLLRWQICADGKPLWAGEQQCAAEKMEFFTPEFAGERWSDHAPVLYDIQLSLFRDGKELDSSRRKWGAVKASVRDMAILINGKPAFLRGVTEHCYFPETANPHWDRDKYLRDLGVLKSAGFNFIRCHTWCPPEEFFEACDELGILVQTELPSVYTFAEAEAVIRMIRKHSCAVIFCEGNEKMLDSKVIARLKELAALLRQLAPGILFNPQEALRGIECALSTGQPVREEPFPHDPIRLAAIREFSDVYGSHARGLCSYGHDLFPDVEEMRRYYTIYDRPCLIHEAGIMGGYLDFSLETRYEDTFIGTDMFRAARKNMQRHGVWQYADKYYRLNALMISAMRKQLLENMRSCAFFAGFDFLGGIDTHWHLNGYPCGVFNEFYEEKYGESIADIRRYNAETILLCAGKWRNRQAGSKFSGDISISHYGADDLVNAVLEWLAIDSYGNILGKGKNIIPAIPVGSVCSIGEAVFDLPDSGRAGKFILSARLKCKQSEWENEWEFWSFPQPPEKNYSDVRELTALSPEAVAYLKSGGAVLLTGGFPGEITVESYRPVTSGRSLGHCGTVIHPHPVWEKFPHAEYAQWHFFPMMTDSVSLTTDAEMPEFTPILELIPPFKLIRRKSLLNEYKVGKGRLLICGLRLDADDPAARWMRHCLLEYLAGRVFAPAPEWNAEDLLRRAGSPVRRSNPGMKIDSGGRPVIGEEK